MTPRRIGNLLGILVGVLGIAFVGVQIARERDAFADALGSANPAWLAASVVAGLASMTGIGLNWIAIVEHHGARAPRRRGLTWFFVGQLGKYVPGGIWPIVGQAELANRGGVPRSAAYPSTGWSMVAQLLGAATVAAGAGFVSSGDRTIVSVLLAAGVVALLAAASAAPLRSFVMRVAERLLPRRELLLPDGGWLAVQVVRHVPVWLLYSAMNISFVTALGTDMTWGLGADVAFATCLSWIAGFVIIGLPGGIGVREALFVSLMTVPLGAGLAASAAVTSRIVTIVVDLLGAGATSVMARRPLGRPDAPAPAAIAHPRPGDDRPVRSPRCPDP